MWINKKELMENIECTVNDIIERKLRITIVSKKHKRKLDSFLGGQNDIPCIDTIRLDKVVDYILDHLGLEMEVEPEKERKVVFVKKEKTKKQ